MDIGEASTGHDSNTAHVSTILGAKTGPVGTAWAISLATPTQGHTPFVVVLQPNIPVHPMTLFINRATVSSLRHKEMTLGPAQAGVAAGVVDAVAQGVIPVSAIKSMVILASVWVDPAANDPEQLYRNNRRAMRTSLVNGSAGLPHTSSVFSALEAPHNPFFTAPPEG